MIEGVDLKKLEPCSGARGADMDILREDDPVFDRFGELRLVSLYPGAIRGWSLHRRRHDYVVCLRGMVKLVLYDSREDSATSGEVNELFLGEYNQVLVHIPPGVSHGIKGIGTVEAAVINCASLPYDPDDPDEYGEPVETSSIRYDWEIRFH